MWRPREWSLDGLLGPIVGTRVRLVAALSVVLVAGASAAGAAAVVDAGAGTPQPVAAQVSDDEHTFEITNDGSARTSYEVSFDGIAGTDGLGPGDEVDGNDASGFVRGGTDTITYRGEITAFSYSGPEPTVLVDGSAVPLSELVNDSPTEHRLEITNDGSAQTNYSVSADGIVGTDGFGTGDEVNGDAASGFVRGGTDAVIYTGNVTAFSYGGAEPTVTVDGTEVDPADLGEGSSGDSNGDDSGAAGNETDSGDAGNETDSGTETDSGSAECLPNPFDRNESEDYSYSEYGMEMPDRFVEDILETDGVEAIYHGYDGRQAGLAWLVTSEGNASPTIYCKANWPGLEGIILSEWRFNGAYTDDYGDQDFTPAGARVTADPTYGQEMGISDQSVEWLLAQDHVERVEHATTCDRAGCEDGVTVYLDAYPLAQEDWWKDLPDRIDGVDVTYAEA